jgi:hypothetical protein
MRICADTCSLTVRLMIFCRMDKLALFRFTTEQGAMEPPYVLTLIVVPRNMQISNTCRVHRGALNSADSPQLS